jgi:hypothetical protein
MLKHLGNGRVFLSASTSVLAACVIGSGCASKEDLTVWKAEVPSPGTQWIARADTVQNGGFGSAHIATSVYLRKSGDSGPGVTVLELSCQGPMPRPYVLDNVANAGGSIHLVMTWLDPSHLRVTYDAHPDLVLHVATFQGVTILAEDLSGGAGGKKT